MTTRTSLFPLGAGSEVTMKVIMLAARAAGSARAPRDWSAYCRRLQSVLAGVLCLTSAAQAQEPATLKDLGLVEAQRFGWSSMGDSSRRLTATEKTYKGGVLSFPISVDEGPDGRVYVLDADYQKIVVFNRDGSFRRVIVGGFGRAPGEFVRPRDIALSNDSRIHVVDQDLRRLTSFDTAGKVIQTRSLAGIEPISMVTEGNRIFVVRWFIEQQPAVFVYDVDGTLVDSMVRATLEDGKRSRYGELGVVGRSSAGNVVYGYPTPGEWIAPSSERNRSGRQLIRAEPGLLNGARFVTAGTAGIGRVNGGRHLIYFRVFDEKAANTGVKRTSHFLSVVDSVGREIGRVDLREERNGAFRLGRNGNDVLIAVFKPYAQIVRYRLSER